VGDENKNTDGTLLFDEDGDERNDRDDESRGSPGDGKAEEAMEFVAGVLSRMGLHAKVSIREDGEEQVVLDIGGADAGARDRQEGHDPRRPPVPLEQGREPLAPTASATSSWTRGLPGAPRGEPREPSPSERPSAPSTPAAS
jgi:hypothetical protein